jgi:hypothetical protein
MDLNWQPGESEHLEAFPYKGKPLDYTVRTQESPTSNLRRGRTQISSTFQLDRQIDRRYRDDAFAISGQDIHIRNPLGSRIVAVDKIFR